MRYLIQLLLLLPLSICAQNQIKTDVIIIGGTGGTMAAIQAARLGVKTVVLEETAWLGGMLLEIIQILQNGITIPEIQSVFDRNGIDLTATFSLQLNRRITTILLQDVLHVFEQGLDYQGELIN